MGSLSIFHWLMLIVLVGSIVLIVRLVRKVSRFEVWFSKWLEENFARSAAAPADAASAQPKPGRFPLPVSFAAVVAILVLFALSGFASGRLFGEGAEVPVSALAGFVSAALCVGLLLVGLAMHFMRMGTRTWKYEFLMSGASLVAAGLFLRFGEFAGREITRRDGWTVLPASPEAVLTAVLWAFAAFVLFQLLARLGPALLVGRAAADGAPSVRQRRVYWWVRRTGFGFALCFFLGLAYPVLVVYLVTRYLAGERMARAPILYLRSFHHAGGPSAFGRIVARVASRYGPLVALIHEKQSALQLHAETRLTERAELEAASEKSWQSWVERRMDQASAVIIDATVSSPGLSWELELALKRMDATRIILLAQKETAVACPANVWRIDYEAGARGGQRAREMLDDRLRGVLLDRKEPASVPGERRMTPTAPGG